MEKAITIGLAGNPNCGKTTVFNNLTGTSQHVGNWPGVTVEKKEGTTNHKGLKINIIDLPGVYGLTAYSLDEVVARNFVVEEKPDVVVDIVDASNIERNLYLTVQLLEMGANLVVALNMTDLAKDRGYKINVEKLSHLLGVAVVSMVASRNQGTQELLDEIVRAAQNDTPRKRITVDYGRDTEKEIAKLEKMLSADPELVKNYPARWVAIKILEGDEEVLKAVAPQS